jgi:hypothetical protein
LFKTFKPLKSLKRYAPFKPPPFFDVITWVILPRVAGEDSEGSLSDLNGFSGLNEWFHRSPKKLRPNFANTFLRSSVLVSATSGNLFIHS